MPGVIRLGRSLIILTTTTQATPTTNAYNAFLQQASTLRQLLAGGRSRPRSRPAGGYDCGHVDGLLSHLLRQDDPAARGDPWRDLSTRGYSTADAWRDFGLPPGTRLSMVKTGAGRSELRGADQHPLVSARQTLPGLGRVLSRDGREYRLGKVTKAQWPAVAAQLSARQPGSPAHSQAPAPRQPRGLTSLADRTGLPVAYVSGRHFNHRADGRVEFPGQRWLRFPVSGTARSNAIMTAVDQAGWPVARYRIASESKFRAWPIEITVHPDQALTDELVLTLAFTAPWIISFFAQPSEGGG